MCTCLLAGKNATLSGRAMLGANDDWDKIPGVLTHVPYQKHGPEETYLLTGGQQIPQVAETWGYSFTACKYEIGTLDRAWAGGVNDRGVAAAGTGASAFKAIDCDDAWMEPDDILLLILSRATSARHGIRLVGDLINQYKLRFSGLESCASMATYAVADSEEGWFLEVAPGAHWVATRVPDNEVGVRTNAFSTHDADLTDTENVMASPNLAEFAREQGWWDGDIRHFDFACAYGSPVSPNEWGPELHPMNMRRRWRAVNLLSGKETPEDAQIYSVVPDHPLTEADFKRVLRDVYQGTQYDLTKVPEAGRYGNPFHDDAGEYSLCRSWTVASFIADLRKNGASSVMWVCMSSPRTGVYMPVYADIEELPAYCEEAEIRRDVPSLFWSFQNLMYLTCRRYSENSSLVEAVQSAYEQEAAEAVKATGQEMTDLSEEERRAAQTRLTCNQIDRAMELCHKTYAELAYRY